MPIVPAVPRRSPLKSLAWVCFVGLAAWLPAGTAQAAFAGSTGSSHAALRARPACAKPRRRHAKPSCRVVAKPHRGGGARPAVNLPAAQVVLTTPNLSDALTTMPAVTFASTPAPGALIIDVDDSIRYQRMIGFGAAMTDSSAWLLYDELTPAQRTLTMQALFGPQGIRLGYVRIPMGASDYTASFGPYSYDDMPAGQTDPTLANFSLAHDEPYVIPALKAALAVNPNLFTVANPWSPPAWMKSNGVLDNKYNQGVVEPQFYPALAQYFVKFIQGYQAAGVPIDAITPMNEPTAASGWPGANLTVENDATFLPTDLVPALAGAGLHPAIYGPDDGSLSEAQTLLAGPAGADMAGAAFHCYDGMGYMSALHFQYPSLPILVNECSPGIIPDSVGEVGIDAADNFASGVQLWNLALDPQGAPYEGVKSWGCPNCTGVVTVDEATHQAKANVNYYQFGQMSKYVQAGATRIYSTRFVTDGHGISNGLDDAAFVNPDGTKVLVAYNNATTTQSFAIDWHGQYASYRLVAHGTVTFTWH